MKIFFLDKIKIIFKVYSCLPHIFARHILGAIINPIDSTRYTEFVYLLNYLKFHNLNANSRVLDVSSPFMLSYLLSKEARVIKTDINPSEKLFIRPSKNLSFQLEDATKLSFKDNAFDLVYSISVIEHIYKEYGQAIKEMIRVCKPGGLIYLTFPVSKRYQEEWLKQDIYSHQYKKDQKIFFQYRFDEVALNNLISQISDAKVISKDIFWERHDGSYDKMTKIMRNCLRNRCLEKLRMAFLNLYYGFSLLENHSAGFDTAKNLGNMSIILRRN